MKRILLLFMLVALAAVHVLAQAVNWSRPKYVMNCVMDPKPMVKDTIGIYEYYGDSVVIYHRLDLLKDRYEGKSIGNGEPFRTYSAFDAKGNIRVEILYYPGSTKTIRFDNTYDALGRLVEVAQSDGVTKKFIYGHKRIKELVLRPGQARQIITHHYKDKACTVRKRSVYWDDGYRADRVHYKYDRDGLERRSRNIDCYESDNLYKANCKFVTDKEYVDYDEEPEVQHQAIIYEWME